MKITAVAPSNIAFIKYWGRKNEDLKLPENGSISMNLSNLSTTTTVEFNDIYEKDEVVIDDTKKETEEHKVIEHLDRIRKIAGINKKAKVVSVNNFPSCTGLSSSASGFAALTVAMSKALGLNLSEKELTILARGGSGSSCRSIPDGFVEWNEGTSSDSSFAFSLYPTDYWDISDVVAVVSNGQKDVSTTEGQKRAESSPFYLTRKKHMQDKINTCKKILEKKDFTQFGELIEAEALELHAIMLTSYPSLIYWTSGTLELMKLTKKMRHEGLEVYFTINTGQDIHLIVQKKDVEKLKTKLQPIDFIKKIIVNYPSDGTRFSDSHLF
jgi:diphosphomevalonate decarboxylase